MFSNLFLFIGGGEVLSLGETLVNEVSLGVIVLDRLHLFLKTTFT